MAAYLDDLGQPYRRDQSNDDLRFTRNRIRGQLLPQLAAQYNPGVVEALLRLGGLAGEAQAVIDGLVGELLDRCVRAESPECVSVDGAALVHQPAYLVRELLMAVWRAQDWPMQAMGLAEWQRLAGMLAARWIRRSRPCPATCWPKRWANACGWSAPSLACASGLNLALHSPGLAAAADVLSRAVRRRGAAQEIVARDALLAFSLLTILPQTI